MQIILAIKYLNMDCVTDKVARSLFLTAQHWVQFHVLHITFVEGKTIQKQVCLWPSPHTNTHSTPNNCHSTIMSMDSPITTPWGVWSPLPGSRLSHPQSLGQGLYPWPGTRQVTKRKLSYFLWQNCTALEQQTDLLLMVSVCFWKSLRLFREVWCRLIVLYRESRTGSCACKTLNWNNLAASDAVQLCSSLWSMYIWLDAAEPGSRETATQVLPVIDHHSPLQLHHWCRHSYWIPRSADGEWNVLSLTWK